MGSLLSQFLGGTQYLGGDSGGLQGRTGNKKHWQNKEVKATSQRLSYVPWRCSTDVADLGYCRQHCHSYTSLLCFLLGQSTFTVDSTKPKAKIDSAILSSTTVPNLLAHLHIKLPRTKSIYILHISFFFFYSAIVSFDLLLLSSAPMSPASHLHQW